MTPVKIWKGFAVLLLAHLVLCVSAPYSAAVEESERKWTMYMRARDGTEYFYDKEAIIETPERTLQVWRKRVFPDGAAQKEILTFDQLTCDFREEYRTLRMSVTNWDGTTKVYDKWTPWAHIYTNSPEQYLVDQHCSQSYRQAPRK